MAADETETIALAELLVHVLHEIERARREMLIDMQFALTRSPKDGRPSLHVENICCTEL